MKCYNKVLLTIILVFLISIRLIIAAPVEETGTQSVTETPTEITTDTKEAEVSTDAQGTADGLKTTFPDGQSGTTDGYYHSNGGRLTTDSYEGDNGGPKYEKVENFYYAGQDDFYAEKASYFEYNGLIARDVNSIYGSPTEITLGSADSIEYKGIELEDATILYADDSVLSVGNADKMEGQDLEFYDLSISDVNFIDDSVDRVKISSERDNNTFDLRDTAQITIDRDEGFEANFNPDGSISIQTKDNTTITADEEKVRTSDSGLNNIIIDEDGFVFVLLPQGASYLDHEKNEAMQPYRIYNQGTTDFALWLRQSQNISNCNNCGMVDKINKKIIFKGIVGYQRDSDETDTFVDVIRSETQNNTIDITLDSGMEKMNITFIGNLSYFYSGPFETRIYDKENYFRYHGIIGVPYAISKINQEIVIDEQGFLKETYQGTGLTMS